MVRMWGKVNVVRTKFPMRLQDACPSDEGCKQGYRDGLRIDNARLYGKAKAADGKTNCRVTKISGCFERPQELKEPVAIRTSVAVRVEAWYL